MELKEFIPKTISEILEGIDNTSDLLKDKNKKVGLSSPGKNDQRHIEFDVAVSVERKKGRSGGFGIKVLEIVGIEGKKSSENVSSTISRIKFGIRIKTIPKA
jgi:hypothetical protein